MIKLGTLSDKLNHTAECKESIREAVNQNLGGAELISSSTEFDQYADIILQKPDVDLSKYKPFSEADWDEIKEAADLGIGHLIYKKGDKKISNGETVTIVAFNEQYGKLIKETRLETISNSFYNIVFSIGYKKDTVSINNGFDDLIFETDIYNFLQKALGYSKIDMNDGTINPVLKSYEYGKDPSIYTTDRVYFIASREDAKRWGTVELLDIPSDCTSVYAGCTGYSAVGNVVLNLSGFNPRTYAYISNISNNQKQSSQYAIVCFCL